MPARAFAGIEDNYFLEVLVPRRPATTRLFTYSVPRPDGKPSAEIATGVSADRARSRPRRTSGPRTCRSSRATGSGSSARWTSAGTRILARPLLWMMKKSYAVVPNWGVAILVVTFLIRLLLFPLTAKSYTSMKKMQKLAPKMNAIRDKYKKAKTDAAQRQKMNAELMALYQTEGYNPMSGCLPVLLQLPVLVAFYNVLSRTIELRHAPFVLWIKDLSAIDHTLRARDPDDRVDVRAAGDDALDAGSRRRRRSSCSCRSLWGFFLKDMPSGLVLYWLFSNLLTIVQQLVMNRIVKEDDPAPPARGTKALKQARAVGREEPMRYEAKTVEEAVEGAARALGRTAAELKYTVIRDEKSFWGGRVVEIEVDEGEPRVAVGRSSSSEAPRAGEPSRSGDAAAERRPSSRAPAAARGRERSRRDRRGSRGVVESTLTELLSAAGLLVEIRRRESSGDELLFELIGDDVEPLLANKGEGLTGLEVLAGRIAAKRLGRPVHPRLDAEGFRAHRKDALEELARQSAEEVRRSRRPQPASAALAVGAPARAPRARRGCRASRRRAKATDF